MTLGSMSPSNLRNSCVGLSNLRVIGPLFIFLRKVDINDLHYRPSLSSTDYMNMDGKLKGSWGMVVVGEKRHTKWFGHKINS